MLVAVATDVVNNPVRSPDEKLVSVPPAPEHAFHVHDPCTAPCDTKHRLGALGVGTPLPYWATKLTVAVVPFLEYAVMFAVMYGYALFATLLVSPDVLVEVSMVDGLEQSLFSDPSNRTVIDDAVPPAITVCHVKFAGIAPWLSMA